MVRCAMGWRGVIVGLFNSLSGRRRRHNRALRYLKEWVASVDGFLAGYHLHEDTGVAFFLQNARQAAFDLIAISHQGRDLIKPASWLRTREAVHLFTAVIDDIESLRRALISPSLLREKLPEITGRLRQSFTRLKERLDRVEYL